MRIRKITIYEVRKHVLDLRSMSDKSLDSFDRDMDREPYKGPHLRMLSKLIKREIQRRIRRGEYDLWK